jgi:putative DNA primase/helicase
LSDARDVASKAAENVARLAALLHVFEHGPAGEIGRNHVDAAARIVSWHLYEAQRYFTETAPTPALVNAEKLEAWLVRRFHERGEPRIRVTTIQQFGPGAIRHREELAAALGELVRRKRARKVKDERGAECVELNPALLGGNHGAP